MFQTHALDLHEIRLRIASSLGRKDLASCARVSQDWNNSFTPLLYKSVALSEYGPSMESVKRNKHLIRHLTIWGYGNKLLSSSVQDQVISSIITNSPLTTLGVSGWMRDSGAQALAEALKANSTLVTLFLYQNSIGCSGAQALAEALKVNSTLAILNVSEDSIGSSGAQALAEALKSNSSLTSLDLTDTEWGEKVGDVGAQALSDALKTNSTLTTLMLCMTSIEYNGAQALADALKTNSTLITLNLKFNLIGCNGAQALSEALKTNTTLTTLNLHDNSIGYNGAQALSDALKTNSTLTTLSLGYNSIGDIGAQALAEALKTNSTLATLDLQCNEIGDNGVEAIHQVLQTTKAATSVDQVFNAPAPCWLYATPLEPGPSGGHQKLLEERIRRTMPLGSRNWDSYLAKAVYDVNSRIVGSIRVSPTQALMGYVGQSAVKRAFANDKWFRTAEQMEAPADDANPER
ncbi:hypothetical protein BGZ58_010520 [Dissophora ornata]|nr:hypothetical protein BGZ58_010520 [Dissophora ornata]